MWFTGPAVSQQFLDKANTDPWTVASIHNNEAGRIAVRKTMRRVCKCHGVSGSCATQTCWRQTGSFKEVGSYLRLQYNKALKVDFNNGVLKVKEAPTVSSNRVLRKSVHTRSEEPVAIKKRKLVFLQSSPDYCRKDVATGFIGVEGRTCVVDPLAKDPEAEATKCSTMCSRCGLEAVRRTVPVTRSCNCKFKWCCNITCQTCTHNQVVITCESSTNRKNDDRPVAIEHNRT